MKTRSYKTRSQKMLLTFAIAGHLSACGGVNSPDNHSVNQSNSEHVNNQQSDVVTKGTIIVEERNGKTVFDAFFSQIAESQPVAAMVDSSITDDSCSVSSVHSHMNASAPVDLGAAKSAGKYASIGTALIIESRVGQFEALVKQQVGDITVYAPNGRWKNVPLPEDALLSFDSDSGDLGGYFR